MADIKTHARSCLRLMILVALICIGHGRANIHNQHRELHQDIHARQDVLDTSTLGLQAFSTIYTYSFWSYSPVTAIYTTTFGSSQVTSSTTITVYAKDQFHALQSLLTAGQSVQESADSSAAQATITSTAPASAEATTTAPLSNYTPDTTSSFESVQASIVSSRSSGQGVALCTGVSNAAQGMALIGAFALANI